MAEQTPSRLDLRRLRRPELVPPALADVLEKLASFPEVSFILIFGSRAFGDSDERSDLDVSISAPSVSRRRWLEMRRVAEDAKTLLQVSLIHFDSSPPALQKRNLQEGVIVYESAKTSR